MDGCLDKLMGWRRNRWIDDMMLGVVELTSRMRHALSRLWFSSQSYLSQQQQQQKHSAVHAPVSRHTAVETVSFPSPWPILHTMPSE